MIARLTARLGERTDARVWGPVGARVEVVAPDKVHGMVWLSVERVEEAWQCRDC